MSVTDAELDDAAERTVTSLTAMLDGLDDDGPDYMMVPGHRKAQMQWRSRIEKANAAREAARADECGICGQDLADHRPVVYGPARRH